MAEAEANECLDAFTHINVAVLALARGDHAEVTARLAAARPILAASADFQDEAALIAVQAITAFDNGEFAEAVQFADGAVEVGSRVGLGSESVRWAWPVGVAAAARMGDLASLDRLVGWLADKPKGHVSPVLHAELALARAMRAGVAGTADPELYAAAAEQSRTVGFVYALARARVGEAESAAAVGDTVRAAQAAVEARAHRRPAPAHAAVGPPRSASSGRLVAQLRWCTSCSPYTGVSMPSRRALSCSAR